MTNPCGCNWSLGMTCWMKARKFFDVPSHIFGTQTFAQNTPFSWMKVPGMYENEGNI